MGLSVVVEVSELSLVYFVWDQTKLDITFRQGASFVYFHRERKNVLNHTPPSLAKLKESFSRVPRGKKTRIREPVPLQFVLT